MSVIYGICKLWLQVELNCHININLWTEVQEVLNKLFVMDECPTMIIVYLMMELNVHFVYE